MSLVPSEIRKVLFSYVEKKVQVDTRINMSTIKDVWISTDVEEYCETFFYETYVEYDKQWLLREIFVHIRRWMRMSDNIISWVNEKVGFIDDVVTLNLVLASWGKTDIETFYVPSRFKLHLGTLMPKTMFFSECPSWVNTTPVLPCLHTFKIMTCYQDHSSCQRGIRDSFTLSR